MRSGALTAVLASLGTVTRAQNCTFDSITPSQDLVWCRCEGDYFCAKLDVPLDYLNPGLARALVPPIKFSAAPSSPDGPYRGMILVNPGGPGASGVELIRENGPLLAQAIGTNYDMVGFDPRGIGLSEPRPNCPAGILAAQTQQSRDVPRLQDAFFQSFIDFGRAPGEQCAEQAGGPTGAGRHMTTAVTARDMLSIVDAFAETPDGARAATNASLLDYYGISYGTFLGQTFASMFPDRVGHVALDGVVDPAAYQANGTWRSVNHLDGVVGAFFVYCHAAGPDACAYYTGTTPMDIFARWKAACEGLDAGRAAAEGWGNSSGIAAALLTFKVGMLAMAVQPLEMFGPVAEALVGLEQALEGGALGEWTEQVNGLIGNPGVASYAETSPEQGLGVICSDQENKQYGKSLEEIRGLIDQLEGQSVVGETWVKYTLGCTGWNIKSEDVFTGPYGGETKGRVLFVSNTFDPTTPIDNAISNAPSFKNARRLTIDGMGHSGIAPNNLCAYGVVKSYFQDTICGKDIYCPLETGPFGVQLEGSIQENLEAAGLANLHDLF
ncbi:alpha beta hydrolase fold family [Colletotrichum kahawae]|uniref:Alpha beta hydrolase fold family n=1 Tax=Colletotrichum kahawae TaxID=34407 RepID=A0AAD9YC92_COLKA|nr:alpha beta hydrolase fold family [Colletotrichum kahawae]